MVALPLQIRLQGGGEVLVWAGVIKDEKVCIFQEDCEFYTG